jgi:hypothetical protein
MRHASARCKRILAIDPTHRGFGYVVIEGPDRLVDWGLCQQRSGQRSDAAHRVRDLVRRLVPDVLVIEDTGHCDCRRSERVRRLLHDIAIAAATLEIRTRLVPATVVRARFAALGAKNKDAVARIVAARFPELARSLPPPRKPWQSEDERMAVFDALALTLEVRNPRASRRRPKSVSGIGPPQARPDQVD